MNIAIIFAGGRGQRLNGSMDSVPKQFLEINKKPILIHTLQRFQEHKEIDKIYNLNLDKKYRTLSAIKKILNLSK